MDYKLICRLAAILCNIFCIGLLLPLGTAIFVDTENIANFATALLIAGVLALTFKRIGRDKDNKKLRIREAFVLITFGWTIICILGTIPYAMLDNLDLVTAFFESVSGFTTTGASCVASYDLFPPSILVWRGLSHWCGAMGVIMLFIIVMPQMNSGASHLFNAELPNIVGDRTLPKIKESAFLVFKIYASLFCLEVILLMLFGTSFLEAVNMALASMSTGGFSYFYDGSVFAFDNLAMEIICIAFMIIGSINFSLYYKIWRGDWHAIRDDAEHRYYLLWLLFTSALVAGNLYFSDYYGFTESIQQGVRQVVSVASTTGFAFADFEKWPGISRLMVLLLMFVGGCSGSAAGGMKIGRIAILLKASWAELMRALHPNIVYSLKVGGRVIAPEIVRNITRFFFMYIFVFTVLTLLISLSGISLLDSMHTIAACLSSTGISGPGSLQFSEISNYAKLVACMAMLLGRLEIFAFLVVLRPDFWRTKKNW